MVKAQFPSTNGRPGRTMTLKQNEFRKTKPGKR
jgi:hypothetical protein